MKKLLIYTGLIFILISSIWVVLENNTLPSKDQTLISSQDEENKEPITPTITDNANNSANTEETPQNNEPTNKPQDEKTEATSNTEIVSTPIQSDNNTPKSQQNNNSPTPQPQPTYEEPKQSIEEIPNEPTPQEIETAIINKYTTKFTALRSEYELKINNLISQAKKEYLSLTEKERTTARFKLGLKYLKLGKSLEDECDDKFYVLLDQMKAELKTNKLPMTSANEAEKAYKKEKSDRRSALMKKAVEIN